MPVIDPRYDEQEVDRKTLQSHQRRWWSSSCRLEEECKRFHLRNLIFEKAEQASPSARCAVREVLSAATGTTSTNKTGPLDVYEIEGYTDEFYNLKNSILPSAQLLGLIIPAARPPDSLNISYLETDEDTQALASVRDSLDSLGWPHDQCIAGVAKLMLKMDTLTKETIVTPSRRGLIENLTGVDRGIGNAFYGDHDDPTKWNFRGNLGLHGTCIRLLQEVQRTVYVPPPPAELSSEDEEFPECCRGGSCAVTK